MRALFCAPLGGPTPPPEAPTTSQELGVQFNLLNALYASLCGAVKSPEAPQELSKSGKERSGARRIKPNLLIHLAQGKQACPETPQGNLQERLEGSQDEEKEAQDNPQTL